MLVDLNKRFQDTSSAYLRNIFRVELGKLVLNLIAYTQFDQAPGFFFCTLAASISGLNFVMLINLKKWIIEDFLEPVKSKVDASELAYLNNAAQIWKIGLSLTIIFYLFMIFGIVPIAIMWIPILISIGIANFGLYRLIRPLVHN
jgi:hypothetical protein